jgi:hypothetical protein
VKRFIGIPVVRGLAFVALAAGTTASALDEALNTNAIAIEVKHRHCEAATRLINPDVKENDRQSAFIVGRLLDEGVCLQPDPQTAAHFFARAAELGDRNGALDFATKVGLGEGVDQDYQRAGDLCRAAGVDPKSQLSSYALGYACTVRGVAGKLLRQALPTGAFKPTAGAAALLEFKPVSREMRILATPHVVTGDPPTGSMRGRPLVDAQKEIDKAWRRALAGVPPPDATRLGNQGVALSVDLDMTLELERKASVPAELQQPLYREDVRSTGTAP